jgi:AcrR family transcriptional regulator
MSRVTKVAAKGQRPEALSNKRKQPRVEIDVRRQPTQERAKQTMDNILETTAALLEEVSIDSFTTNLLAERAGIPVRSVYRYYPNKIAVIVAIWKKMLNEWDDLLHEQLRQLGDPHVDLDFAFKAMGEVYINWLSTRRGAWAVRRCIRAMPELVGVERWAEDWYVSRVSKALRQRGIDLSDKQLKTMTVVIYRAANAIVNSEMAYYGSLHQTIVNEMFAMTIAYVKLHVGDKKMAVRAYKRA